MDLMALEVFSSPNDPVIPSGHDRKSGKPSRSLDVGWERVKPLPDQVLTIRQKRWKGAAFFQHFSSTPSVSKEQSPHSQPLRCRAEPGELTFVWLRVGLLPLQLGRDFPSAAGIKKPLLHGGS